MKARTDVLEAELRRKTNIEDRVKAAENNLQSLSTSVESQFSANDRRWARAVGVFFVHFASSPSISFCARSNCACFLPDIFRLPKTPKFGLKSSVKVKSAASLQFNCSKTGSRSHLCRLHRRASSLFSQGRCPRTTG